MPLTYYGVETVDCFSMASGNFDSDVVLESGNVLESDSSPYFEDSDSDLDS